MEIITIAQEAYLYSMWSGELKIIKGEVFRSRKNGKLCDTFFNSEKPKKRIGCHPEEGEFYNSVIWFYKRNDREAIEELIGYEEVRIMELQEKIDNHRRKIKTLDEHLKNTYLERG